MRKNNNGKEATQLRSQGKPLEGGELKNEQAPVTQKTGKRAKSQ